MSARFGIAALMALLTGMSVACAAPTGSEDSDSTASAVENDPVAQAEADFDALLRELEAQVTADENGICLVEAHATTDVATPDRAVEAPPTTPSIPSTTPTVPTPQGATPIPRMKIQGSAPGALVEWLATRLERLEGLTTRIEKANKTCSLCAGSSAKLAALLERTVLNITEGQKLLKAATTAAINTSLWRNLSASERFDMQRWLRYGEWFNSKTQKYERGVPTVGYWPSWYKPYQDAFTAQRKAVEDMVRLESLVNDFQTLNFIAKFHLDKCSAVPKAVVK